MIEMIFLTDMMIDDDKDLSCCLIISDYISWLWNEYYFIFSSLIDSSLA